MPSKGMRRFAPGHVCAEPCAHPLDRKCEINTGNAGTWQPRVSKCDLGIEHGEPSRNNRCGLQCNICSVGRVRGVSRRLSMRGLCAGRRVRRALRTLIRQERNMNTKSTDLRLGNQNVWLRGRCAPLMRRVACAPSHAHIRSTRRAKSTPAIPVLCNQ